MADLSTEEQLTWKRVTRSGRTYWHLFNADGTEARPIIGIEGQLIEEIERLRQENRLLKNGLQASISWLEFDVAGDVKATKIPDTSSYTDIYKNQLADMRAAKGLL